MKTKPPMIISLPYAGGSSYAYRALEQYLGFSFFSPELPGRNRRLSEEYILSAEALTADIYLHCRPFLQQPYMILGHSMGALLGYLLTKKIIAAGLPQPFHLLFSGRGGPSAIPRRQQRYRLPRSEFYRELETLGGISPELMADENYMAFFEPLLRADFEVVETYCHRPSPPVDIPITVVTGTEEDITTEEKECWQLETTRPVELRQLPGNHFFLFEHAKDFCTIIQSIIKTTHHGSENVVSKA